MLDKLKIYLKESLKYLVRSYPFIKGRVKKIQYLYSLTPIELDKYKEKQFIKLFQHAYDNSPFYQRFYSEAGINRDDIKTLKDITKLPIITREIVYQNALEMLTVPKYKVIKSPTSGTSGSPLTLFHSHNSILNEQAYIYVTRLNAGFKTGEKLVSLRGSLGKNQISMFIHLKNTLFLSSYNINENNIDHFITKIIKFAPKAIEGYPSSLCALAMLLKEKEIRLNIPLTFTSSETLNDFQRHLIEDRLNTHIYDLYGLTEQTIMLMENNNHEGYYEPPGYSINEYVEDGEICTSLINFEFPLIRYKSNDIIEFSVSSDKNISIKRILGRDEDYVICKDGSKVMRLDFLLKGIKNVKFSQIIQEKIGYMKICIVPDINYSINDQEEILKRIYERIGKNNIEVSFNLIKESDLIKGARNKFKYIISKIK